MTVSNILIIIASIITALSVFIWWLSDFWINRAFISEASYHFFFLQFFLYQFLHWSLLHLVFNSVFIFVFWNWLEDIMWRWKYITFFVFNTFFVWISLFFLSSPETNTIWISWFCMALLTYFTLELYTKKNPEYKWWVTAIIVNLAIWFMPEISLIWHLFWTIWGILFFIYNKDKKTS